MPLAKKKRKCYSIKLLEEREKEGKRTKRKRNKDYTWYKRREDWVVILKGRGIEGEEQKEEEEKDVKKWEEGTDEEEKQAQKKEKKVDEEEKVEINIFFSLIPKKGQEVSLGSHFNVNH